MFEKVYASSLPIQATDIARRWDQLYDFLVLLSVFFFVLVVGGMIVFAIQYRKRPDVKPKYITGNHLLEGIFIIVPTLLLLMIFGWGWIIYRDMVSAPTDAYEIRVIGKQWLWQFQYDNGRSTTGELFVPVGKPVKLVMTSDDVLHSFFVPNFRIKQDAVPGMYTSVWFETSMPGKHQIFCAEYCGTAHSGMLGKVVVLTAEQWKDWYAGKEIGPIPDVGIGGKVLSLNDPEPKLERTPTSVEAQATGILKKYGCVACHSVDGSMKTAPTFKGLYGSTVELSNGKTVKADENYLRRSIEDPNAETVKGFPGTMPVFKGLISETELNSLMMYFKSIQ